MCETSIFIIIERPVQKNTYLYVSIFSPLYMYVYVGYIQSLCEHIGRIENYAGKYVCLYVCMDKEAQERQVYIHQKKIRTTR